MTEWLNEADFNEQLRERVARLRDEGGWSQAQMAVLLGVPFERYKKYETRSVLPPYLAPRLAMLVNRDVEYVLTGRTNPRRVRESLRVENGE